MNIVIGEKLLSRNLPQLIEKYWTDSFKNKMITFDLSDTEWISNAEVLFIIAWMNALSKSNKSVGIQLQRQGNDSIESDRFKRKAGFQNKLLNDWKIRTHLIPEVGIYDGGIARSYSKVDSINDIFRIPLIVHKPESFDKEFKKLYYDQIGLNRSYRSLLNETNLDYFDSDFLTYSIVKELYSNICIHSELAISDNCYYSISINRKIPSSKWSPDIDKDRLSELSKIENEYFTDNRLYRNIDYVELNIQDFGIGIANSLRNKYKQDKDNLEKYFDEYYNQHQQQNEDSRIIHYALLLFTSRYEIDRNFQIHDFIPRGLFILKELVLKYQGYLEIFSGHGALSISFDGTKERLRFAKPESKYHIFPGTRIRLVFPSKTAFVFQKESHFDFKEDDYISNDKVCIYNYINLLHNYLTIKKKETKNKNNKYEIDIQRTSVFFQNLLNSIINSKKGCIILLDLAGLDKDYKDILNKLIYFISHTPTNSSYRIILFNVLIKDLNATFLSNQNTKEKSEGFFPYPVPIIYPNLTSKWLGIEDESFSDLLLNIWKGDLSKENQHNDYIVKYSSSIIKIIRFEQFNKVAVSLPSFEIIVTKIKESFNEFIRKEVEDNIIEYDELKNNKHDYNIILRKKEGVIYHNSNGSYQDTYLSFNDKLYIRSYRRLIATHLLFNAFYSNIELRKINKILSVTLSSQFIAFEVQNIYNELFERPIELVALSNYYNFYNERGFKNIRKGDKILIVNDIISTGRLTENIFESLEKKEAIPVGCLSIVDLRKNVLTLFEYPIISLLKYNIKRFEERPTKMIIEWINPILNIPVSINQEKSDLQTLMDKSEFLALIEENIILIGNMKNNSYFMTYYLDTKNFILKDKEKDFIIIKSILERLINKKRRIIQSELLDHSRGLKIICHKTTNENSRKLLEDISKQIEKINLSSEPIKYSIDLVFYPFLSNISLLEEDLEEIIVKNSDAGITRIFPIPRIQTERGWRFTFPPKFLNVITSKELYSVLIIDDGSNTGATLTQMIDSIAFLRIRSIDVLSLFGTLEDYQKELFFRIKSIKVKGGVIPINMHFGVHFNLPVHNERENPFLNEAREIDELKEKFNNEIPGQTFKEFLESYKSELLDIVYPQDLTSIYPIFDFVSKKQMLEFRDSIGLFDSFRFYSEDIPPDGNFEYFVKNDELIITLLSVLNLEPNLFKTIKRLISPELIEKIRESIFKFLNDDKFIDSTKKQIFFIKALQYIDPSKFIESSNLIRLVNIFIIKKFDVTSYQYLNYLLFLIGFKIRSIEDVVALRGFRSNIIDFLIAIEEENPKEYHKFRFFSEFYRNYYSVSKDKVPQPLNIFLFLSDYYLKTINNIGSHDEKLLSVHFNPIERETINLLNKLNSSIGSITAEDENDFFDELDLFKIKYEIEYKEYKYIKSVVKDLKNYGSFEFEFNPNQLFTSIDDFETSLDIKIIDKNNLIKLNENIEKYRSTFLFSNSAFPKFILKQFSNIGLIWDCCENQIHDPQYKKIFKLSSLNFDVLVNEYVLLVAFRNLIKNKNQYAKDAKWEISAIVEDANRIDLKITQYSSFITGGDGTGFISIKEFLYHNGAFYRRTDLNPFTIRINLPLKIK